MSIAYRAIEAKIDREWGVITALSKYYEISRTFVYILRDRLIALTPHLFFPNKESKSYKKKEIIETILSYRLEGGMSIGAISTVMKRQGLDCSGASTISQSLSAIGALISSTESIPKDKALKKVTLLLDEIFIGSQPILITVEPISSTILNIELADNRKGETWEKHINQLTDKRNIEIINSVTDEGAGILLGIKSSLPNTHRQSDTFHTLSHRLGIWVHRLESKAYCAIENEYEREIVCLNRKTVASFEEKQELYQEACAKTIEAIELYENFKYFYTHAIRQLNPFKSNGELRDMIKAKEEIEVALELIETLEYEKINKEISGIKKILPHLLDYFDDAKKAIRNCKALGIDNETIRVLSLEWQWNKALIKAKNKERRSKAKEELTRYSLIAKQMLWEDYEIIKEKVFNELDTIIQASSMVENINSLLRPYLNRSKNQVTQEFLNLFAFYHNHRVYKRGKRAGKTPMEILIGEKQEKDWIELLIERVESREVHFFSK
jgi:hypothetical protein